MRFVKVLLFSAVACLFLLPATPVCDTRNSLETAKAEMLVEHDSVSPGIPVSAALRLIPAPGWHVYWKYAGDFGAEPKLNWSINGQRVEARIHFPVPARIRSGPFLNYGYSQEVLYLSDIEIPSGTSGKSLVLELDAEWLACREECIPGNGRWKKTLPIIGSGQNALPSREAGLFETFRQLLPLPGDDVVLKVSSVDEQRLTLEMDNVPPGTQKLFFIPRHSGLIENSADQSLRFVDGKPHLTLYRASEFRSEDRSVEGLLIRNPPWSGSRTAREITFEVPARDSVPGRSEHRGTSQQAPYAFLITILTAFIGGLILNLMPCIFPVLSIKVLALLEQAGNEPGRLRRHGFFFTVGVILSFWILAILVRFLKAAGEELGWGFQLQNPEFVAVVVLLLVGITLNLFGVFEFGSSLQRMGGRLESSRSGYLGSLWGGVLAVILATPCTAPFMGSAVAFALSASTLESLLIFTSLALGLSLPYTLLTLSPALMTRLPRPGAWMENFKQLMGFPMLLTVLWLMWVFDQQAGREALFRLLFASLLLSFILWLYGRTSRPAAALRLRRAGTIICLAGIVLSLITALPGGAMRTHIEGTDGEGNVFFDSYGQRWYAYSEERVRTLVENRIPVYLDFTAAWCITCQVNKKVVFGSEQVRDSISKKRVALVRADWTSKSPEISRALAQFGRAGVPFNLIYKPGRKDPVILPTLLTPGVVLETLDDIN